MKKLLIRRSNTLALTSLLLASIPPAYASTPPSDSEDVAFCRVVYEEDHALFAAKPAAVKAEDPRTVRMIYFRPNDRPFRAEVVDSMKVAILQIQAFFAAEMQRHGHGNLTFRFETDDQGEPLVHRVDGEHADAHYLEQAGARLEIWRAIGGSPIEVVVLDLSADTVPYFAGGAGAVTWRGQQGVVDATVLVPSAFSWRTVAHELGHAFWLDHDFRDSEYLMSYGAGNRARLSACAAEYLTLHPYFNPGIDVAQGASPSTIELLSPLGYPAGSESIPVRLRISDSSGLHQVLLFATTTLPHFAAGGAEVKECRSFSGERTAVVEFDYDGLIPSKGSSSLANPIVHRIRFWAVDTLGRTSRLRFTLYQFSDRHLATLEEPGTVTSLAFSPGGILASAAGGSLVKLWDLETRETTARLGPVPPVRAVAISPDGTTLASEHNGTVELWEVATGTNTATLEGRPGDLRYRAVAFSPPDGATLAVVSGYSTVKLWDWATGANYADLDHDSHVTSFAFSSDGTRLASTSGEVVTLWDPATGEPTGVLEGHTHWVGAVAFSPDGATLASQAGWDGLVKLWDVETQRTVATIENVKGGSAMAFSSDGATLACASGYLVKLWDVGTRTQIDSLAHGSSVEVVAFSPDGKTLASGTWKAVELWDAAEWLNPRPHELVKISGDGQEGSPGATLENPLVVEVRDQHGNPIAGAPVTFAVTEGDGRIGGRFTIENRETDDDGRVISLLTLGTGLGTTTVEARLLKADPVTFAAVTVELPIPPVGDRDPRKWHLPDRATVRLGKGSIVEALATGGIPVAFSSDGQRLAVPTSIGIWLYDAATVGELDLLPGTRVTSAAFSPDGTLAAGSYDGTVVLWDVASGENTTLYRHDGGVHSVAFSADGTVLASKSESRIRLWDVVGGVELWNVASEESGSVAFSADGTILAVTGRKAVSLWEVASAAIVTTLDAAALDNGTEIRSVALSPDGATLASGSRRTLKLWDVAQGRDIATLPGHTDGITSVAFSSDGATLASGSYDKTARLWDIATERNIATFGHSTPVQSVAFSPDGATLASMSWDDILLWDIPTESAAQIQGHTLSIHSVAFSPGGGTLAIGSGGSTRLWDVRTGRNTATLESRGQVNSVTFSPDGSILAIGHDRLRLWDVDKRQDIATPEGPISIWSLAFSPDGATLASGHIDGTVQLWDVDQRQGIATLPGHTRIVTSLAFSADGATLASGSGDETARLWDVETRQEIATLGHSGEVSVAFSADGATLASGSRISLGVRLWEEDPWKEIATLWGQAAVYSLAFSPVGATLAAGDQDGTVLLWDAKTRKKVATLEGHIADISSLDFSPDGATLVSGSRDGTVLLWDLTPRPHALRIVSGAGQEGQPGALLAGSLVVEVRDENGDLLEGTPVTFTVTSGGGTLTAATVTTDSTGKAAATLTLGNRPGPNTVEATVAGLEPVTFTATGLAMPRTLTTFSGQELEGPAGSALSEPFVVEVRDQVGGPLAGAQVTFTVTSGGGTLTAAAVMTDSMGRAAATLTLGSQPGPNIVEVRVAELEPVTFTATGKVTPDFDGDGVTGFADFFLFAEAFGGSDPRFDLDASGTVDFADFFLFAEHFGQPARAKLMALAQERIGLPDTPQLHQNWPNPFNSETVITWFLLQPGPARLEVFALTGQRVAVLTSGHHEAGRHRLHWDGRDDQGRPLASGTYLYRLVTAEEEVLARKFALIR